MQKGNYRTSGHKTEPVSVEDVQTKGSSWRRRAVSIAVAAAVPLSVGMLPVPAQAATADGWDELEPVAVVAPFSQEEIRALRELGDTLGANSRVAANRFAMGYAYSTH